jgi:hypothetical protein
MDYQVSSEDSPEPAIVSGVEEIAIDHGFVYFFREDHRRLGSWDLQLVRSIEAVAGPDQRC